MAITIHKFFHFNDELNEQWPISTISSEFRIILKNRREPIK